MLTDVFFRRYHNTVVVEQFNNDLRILFAQAATIITKQIYPTYDWQGKESKTSSDALDRVEAAICMEMGLQMLGSRWFFYDTQWNGNTIKQSSRVLISTIITNYLQETFKDTYSPDKYVKFRLSIIELVFRQKEKEVKALEADLPRRILEAKRKRPMQTSGIRLPGNLEDGVRAQLEGARNYFNANVNELNVRLRQAGLNFQYNNEFIQGSRDAVVAEQLEKPVWSLLSDIKWKNVDIDMKEALDRRDNGDRDPVFYAARALESTIKIISDEKGFTIGSEKGAAQYIQNLVSAKNGRFIEVWESDALITFFSKVRNPLGHGPGSEEMPRLTQQQNEWAIENCMSWIKSLIRRM